MKMVLPVSVSIIGLVKICIQLLSYSILFVVCISEMKPDYLYPNITLVGCLAAWAVFTCVRIRCIYEFVDDYVHRLHIIEELYEPTTITIIAQILSLWVFTILTIMSLILFTLTMKIAVHMVMMRHYLAGVLFIWVILFVFTLYATFYTWVACRSFIHQLVRTDVDDTIIRIKQFILYY